MKVSLLSGVEDAGSATPISLIKNVLDLVQAAGERDDLRAMLTKVEDWMERSEVRRMEYLSAKESAEAEVARLSALLRKAEEALVWCADAPMCETDRLLGRTEEEIASDMLAWLNRKPDHYNETLDRPRPQERRDD